MSRPVRRNSTGNIARVRIFDEDGLPWPGRAHDAAGLQIWYTPLGGSPVQITLSAGNWTEAKHGWYEVAVPNSAYTGTAPLQFSGEITDGTIEGPEHVIVGYDPLAEAIGAATAAQANSIATNTVAARSAAEAAAVFLDSLTELDDDQLRLTAKALELADVDLQPVIDAINESEGADTAEIAAAVLAGLGSVQITRIGPEFDPETSTVTLIAGDDYLVANGSALTFAITLPDIDLANARAVFSAERTYHTLLPGSAELIDTDTDAPKLRLQWTRSQTNTKPNTYAWGVAIIDAAGLVKTIIGGPLILKPAAVNPAVVSKVLEVSG